MGRQFSFFLGPNDQHRLEAALMESGDCVFISDRSNGPVAEVLPTSIILDFVRVPHKVCIARRIDLPRIKFRPIPAQGCFVCDSYSEPIVEFSRIPQIIDGRFLAAGRLYHVVKFWNDEDELESKSPDFIKWAERLYRRTKKSLTKIESGYYAGEEALELRKAGVMFEGLDASYASLRGRTV